ncbi:Zn-dependent hydrolase [Pantoea sp. BAV 3049]|uniref:Zn-dependent hydrolase n=1 Tax=Pantoea sp. BAV 3049 TaxID=2654188 RepID=UPI00131E3CAB|nr:Zn-dependent hydrolase [Pantoea sp. BAV 3049]
MNTPSGCPEPDYALCEQMLTVLKEHSFDGTGITRDSYGAGEQKAHQLVEELALKLGLGIKKDAALNMFMILPGKDRQQKPLMIGSHLDSVPNGGNFDGAIGVLAGLSIVSGWRAANLQPPVDIIVLAIRAEESAWFPVSYVGSKAALGLLTENDLHARRRDTGLTLAEHISQCGGDPGSVAQQQALYRPENIRAFFEIHIEQGPQLEEQEIAVGIVSGICGSLRYRFAKTRGSYAHSGATPRLWRQDAVVATATLIALLQRKWQQLERQGHRLTFTCGRFFTDAVAADMSKVSGEVDFCLDFRSESRESLLEMDRCLAECIVRLEKRYGVTITPGEQSSSSAAGMDAGLKAELQLAAETLAIPVLAMPSGAGHDSAMFAASGVPAAMLFVRNQNGSHNPHEAMELPDLAKSVQLLNLAVWNVLTKTN